MRVVSSTYHHALLAPTARVNPTTENRTKQYAKTSTHPRAKNDFIIQKNFFVLNLTSPPTGAADSVHLLAPRYTSCITLHVTKHRTNEQDKGLSSLELNNTRTTMEVVWLCTWLWHTSPMELHSRARAVRGSSCPDHAQLRRQPRLMAGYIRPLTSQVSAVLTKAHSNMASNRPN